MKIARVLSLAVATLLGVGSKAFADAPIHLYPDVEARVASELLKAESQVRVPYKGNGTGSELIAIATSLAKLGRLEGALKTVGDMPIYDADVANGSPQTRADVLRLVVRRRAVLGNLKGAAELIPRIKVPTLRADAMLALARANLRRGEIGAARQLLFQVSPLVKSQSNATAYTAYLLANSGDMAAAKRLFARAEALLKPPVKPDPQNGTSWRINGDRDYVGRYLLKAGFVDEWLKVADFTPPVLETRLLDSLIKNNRLDLVVRLARNDPAPWNIGSMAIIAAAWGKQKCDRAGALKLLEEAETAYRALPVPVMDPNRPKVTDARIRTALLVVLAHGRRELGDEATAQKWVEEGTTRLSPDQAASLRIQLAITPLAVAHSAGEVLPPAKLKQINAEVAQQLPLLRASRESYDLLRWLTDALVKARQMDDLRAALPSIERLALASLADPNNSQAFTSAVQTAKLWREAGDEAHAQALLKALYEMPDPVKLTKSERAQQFIIEGFIDEGQARIATLPSPPQPIQWDEAFWEGYNRPQVFPEWIAQIKDPYERLQVLASFTKAFTDPLFESQEERELVLSTGGYSSSG